MKARNLVWLARDVASSLEKHLDHIAPLVRDYGASKYRVESLAINQAAFRLIAELREVENNDDLKVDINGAAKRIADILREVQKQSHDFYMAAKLEEVK